MQLQDIVKHNQGYVAEEAIVVAKDGTFFNLKAKDKFFNLTRKETEVIKLLMAGKRAKEIAYDLDLSLHTINTHLGNIKNKLKCSNIFELGLFLGELKEQRQVIL